MYSYIYNENLTTTHMIVVVCTLFDNIFLVCHLKLYIMSLFNFSVDLWCFPRDL